MPNQQKDRLTDPRAHLMKTFLAHTDADLAT